MNLLLRNEQMFCKLHNLVTLLLDFDLKYTNDYYNFFLN